MPTTLGYTGQYADATTGLCYYGARYYDPLLGQFSSADTASDGQNRYGYVHGNPTTYADPTGHLIAADGAMGGLEQGENIALLEGDSGLLLDGGGSGTDAAT